MLPYMCKRFAYVGRTMSFQATTVPEWRAWRRRLRRRLKDLTGYDTMERAPLKPKTTEHVEDGDLVRERVEIQTEPGVVMPLYVLRRRDLDGPLPAVLCPHGHGSGGKLSPAGVRQAPEVARAIEEFNYDYGVQLARAGLIAFCPDARGFGERRESGVDLMGSSCAALNNMGYPLGQTVTGMWTWDLHRLIDYVERRPDCRPGGVACAGLSGGGLQTLWATALDDRIRCAVVSGYMYGYKESLLEMCGNCPCNYVPRLYEYVDMGDIAALIAPRPLLVETGDKDPLNGAGGVRNVRSQMAIARRAYGLLGVQRAIRHDVFAGAHRWHGVEAVPWLARQMDARGQ
jgi:dienelactone hydrolase